MNTTTAPINLSKGERLDLTKGSATTLFRFGLGWNANAAGGAAFDLDASALICKYDGNGDPKLISNPGFVFYNNLKSADGAVVHSGDNLTGDGDGDDEVITLDTSKIDPNVDEIALVVTIHDAAARRQNFGQVKKAYVRIMEGATGEDVKARFDLEEDYSAYTAVHFGSAYKTNGEWKFKPIGAGLNGSLTDIIKAFGAQV